MEQQPTVHRPMGNRCDNRPSIQRQPEKQNFAFQAALFVQSRALPQCALGKNIVKQNKKHPITFPTSKS
ncbi:hypothetical protein, partial [Kingella oralis]|uniref:hypothetical protein n=1 Tax=Kingella oralis TaxID=505 RepID=UPI002D7E9F37